MRGNSGAHAIRVLGAESLANVTDCLLVDNDLVAELFQAGDESLTDTSRFLAELRELPEEEWPTRLRRLVSDKLSKILRRSIDPDRPLSEYGLDSLANLPNVQDDGPHAFASTVAPMASRSPRRPSRAIVARISSSPIRSSTTTPPA